MDYSMNDYFFGYDEYEDLPVIESFMNFNEELFPATEGIKEVGKRIWVSIKALFHRIGVWFKNILLNINYFKNARLPKKQIDDMLQLLRMSQCRVEENFSVVMKFYKFAGNLIKQDANGKYKSESKTSRGIGVYSFREAARPRDAFGFTRDFSVELCDQIDKVSISITNTIDNTKESDLYKRYTDGQYSQTDITNIPLTSIIGELKKSNNAQAKYEGELNKIEVISEKTANKKGTTVVSKMKNFLYKVINYFNFRITILSTFLKHSKASLTGIGRNIKEGFKKEFSGKTNTKIGKMRLKIRVGETARRLYNDALDADTYAQYKPLYSQLCKELKIPEGSIIYKPENGMAMYTAPRKNNVIKLTGQKLYHDSYIDNIPYLVPKWKAGGGALFPTPRVYAHVNIALVRYSSNNASYVYEGRQSITTAYSDPELGRTAVYVESDKPIPVKQVDKNEINKLKDVDITFRKED